MSSLILGSWKIHLLIFFLGCIIFLMMSMIVLEKHVFLEQLLVFSFLKSEMNSYFLVTVLIISICVFSWALFYMMNSSSPVFFSITLSLFVLSMVLLLMSNSFFSVFLGWEGLGVTSFLLIIFYQNWNSLKGGLLTLLTNRIGDGLLMVSFSYWLITFPFLNINKSASLVLGVLFCFLSMTKSAQMPFTSWLPAAMAAPTPVSSLVHSSTLVTAGIWLLINYTMISMNHYVLVLVGFMTLLLASTAALVETDGKKIVALSTLSQLGFMFMALFTGGMFICLFHLLMHAFAKANLFLVVGNIIHNRFSQQDLRFLSGGVENCLLPVLMLISVFSLSGMVFMSGFFSKDCILLFEETLLNTLVSFFLLMSIISLTFSYCLKLLSLSFFLNISNILINQNKSLSSILNILPLSLLSVLSGFFFMNNFLFLNIFLFNLSGKYWLFLILIPILFFLKKMVSLISIFRSQFGLIDFLSFKILSFSKNTQKKLIFFTENFYLSSSFSSFLMLVTLSRFLIICTMMIFLFFVF